jgi:regulatory protein
VTLEPAEQERGAEAAYAKAVELLAHRPHFEAELKAKLEARGFGEAAVAAALARLVERGYLDDRAAARQWAEGAVARKGYGSRRLRAELAARGVDPEIAAEAVAAACSTGERERALAAAGRFRGSDPKALARHLDRKGFSTSVILEIVDRFRRAAPDRDSES